MSKQDFNRTGRSTSSNGETTLRARLRIMHDLLIELIRNIQETKKEVKEYKNKMKESLKGEAILAAKQRTEQQTNAKRYKSTVKVEWRRK